MENYRQYKKMIMCEKLSFNETSNKKKSLSHLMKRCNYFRFSDHRIIDMLFCPNFLVGVLKILRIHSKNSQNVGLFSSSSMRRTCAASLLDFPIFSSGSVKPVEPGLAPVQCSSSSRVALTQIWRHGVSCVVYADASSPAYQFVEVNFSSKTSAKPFCGIPIIQCKIIVFNMRKFVLVRRVFFWGNNRDFHLVCFGLRN